MIIGKASDHFEDLDKFVIEQKTKILTKEIKYSGNESKTTEFVKNHLIDEILETFNIRGTENGNVVREILSKNKIDILELKDIALMSWLLKLSIEEDNNHE